MVKYAKEIGYTIVWTAHNIMPHDMGCAAEENHLMVRNAVIALCDHIIVHDQRAAEALVYKFTEANGKIGVAPHGLYEKELSYNPTLKKEIRDALEIDSSKFVVLLAGRIRGYKGIERAIKIFTSGKHKLLETSTLVIAGCPDDKIIDAEIKNAVAEYGDIKYIRGEIPDNDLEMLFLASDICLLPYEKSATSGLAFLSVSYRTPLITSKLPAFENFVEDGMAICADNDTDLENAIYFTSKAYHQGNLDYIFRGVTSDKIRNFEWDAIVQLPSLNNIFGNVK